jgi:hypothetical protein
MPRWHEVVSLTVKDVTVQGGKMMVGGDFSSLPPQGERFGVR